MLVAMPWNWGWAYQQEPSSERRMRVLKSRSKPLGLIASYSVHVHLGSDNKKPESRHAIA